MSRDPLDDILGHPPLELPAEKETKAPRSKTKVGQDFTFFWGDNEIRRLVSGCSVVVHPRGQTPYRAGIRDIVMTNQIEGPTYEVHTECQQGGTATFPLAWCDPMSLQEHWTKAEALNRPRPIPMDRYPSSTP